MSLMELALASGALSSQFAMVIAAGIIVPSLIYFIYRFSIKEKSFEEVLEEQKQRSLEEEQRQKSEKSKKKEKFKRSWAKKKEKVEQEPIPEPQPVEEARQIPQIEIIEPKEVKIPKQKNKKNASPGASQKTASNAVEKPKKVEVAVGTDKQVQETKKETKREAPQAPKIQVEEVKLVSKPTENLRTKAELAVETKSSSSPPSQAVSVPAKKKKKEIVVEKETAPLSLSKIMSFLKDGSLDTDDIQNLIDTLLNMQKDSAGWTKPNDQLADTKRNLLEKEQKLEQELRQNQVVVSKLKELREEYNQLKVKYSSFEKSSQDKVGRQQQEIQSYAARVKQLQDQCTAEKDKFIQIEKQVEENLKKALKGQKIQLQQKLSQFEAEFHPGVSQAEVDEVKKSREDLHMVHTLLVEQHTQLVSASKTDLNNLKLQLSDAKKQFDEVKAQNLLFSKDVQSLKDSKVALEKSKKSAEDLLLTEKKRSADLENQAKSLSSGSANIAQLQTEVKNLQLENERLTEQLVSNKERVAGDGQEIVHQNGELNGTPRDEASPKLSVDWEHAFKQQEIVLLQLKDDLVKLQQTISAMDKEHENLRKKNNELRERNYKLMDALKQAEESKELAEQKLKEVQASAEKKLAEVKKEYDEKLASSNSQVNAKADLAKRAEGIEAESADRLKSYENEKVKSTQLASEVDRLTAKSISTELELARVEKSVDELKNQLEQYQIRTRECLQRIQPQISIDSSLPYTAWLAEFEKQAIHTVSSSSEVASLKALLEDKEKQYQTVLTDTEVTLNSLEEKAGVKEVQWQERLKNEESKYNQLQAESRDKLQSTLQQVGQLDELQEKLKELHSSLEAAESEKSHTEQKFEEIQRNCINLRDQLENKELQIKELHSDKTSIERLDKELVALKFDLEKERKVCKDFSSQMVKLSSLVKIGQDSLLAEQNMVKKLKSQLDASQVSTTNGGTKTALSTPVTQIESQPKTKSSEKSKKKMDASAKK